MERFLTEQATESTSEEEKAMEADYSEVMEWIQEYSPEFNMTQQKKLLWVKLTALPEESSPLDGLPLQLIRPYDFLYKSIKYEILIE